MPCLNRNYVEEIAQLALGEINQPLSNRRELRFGSKGSKVLNTATFEWFDHELQEGGGLPQLLIKAGIVEELNEAISYAALLEVQDDNINEEGEDIPEIDFTKLWDTGRKIELNSQGDYYFKMRGVELPTNCDSVKFFERSNIKGKQVPAIGAAFRQLGSNNISAIMFTHLYRFKKGELGKVYAKGSNKANSAIQITMLAPNDTFLGCW
jgi:hypothetical protein